MRQQGTALKLGQPVYIRSYSTRRAAIAELLALVYYAGRDWGRVRLATPWYDWDQMPLSRGPAPAAGEVLQVEAYRLEPVRW